MTTLKSACEAGIDTLIAAGGTLPMFSTVNHGGGQYVRDAGCWVHSLRSQLAAVPVWNSYRNSAQGCGVLITPRHILYAWHYRCPAGTQFRFAAPNDTSTYTLPIIANTRIADTDIAIATLAGPVDWFVQPVKLLPADWADYAGEPNESGGFPDFASTPTLTVRQNLNAVVHEVYGAFRTATTGAITVRAPLAQPRLDHWQDIIAGDSGQPCFFVINGQLVLVWAYYAKWAFYAYGNLAAEHVAAIEGVIGDEALAFFDLSGFESFEPVIPASPTTIYFSDSLNDGDMDAAANWVGGVVPAFGTVAGFDPTYFVGSGIPKTGTLAVDAVLTGDEYYIEGGTFHGTVTVNGSASIQGGTFYGRVNAKAVTGGAIVCFGDLAIASGQTLDVGSGGSVVVHGDLIAPVNLTVAKHANGTLSLLSRVLAGVNEIPLYAPESLHVASPTAVRVGVDNLGVAGTLVLPAENVVSAGSAYGADGTELEGTFVQTLVPPIVGNTLRLVQDGPAVPVDQNVGFQFAMTFVDAEGTAIDLTGRTVVIHVFHPDTPETILETIVGSVSETQTNLVTFTGAAADTPTAGSFSYKIINTTDSRVLRRGAWLVKEGPALA